MSTADQLRDRLRAQPLPGEADAAARSWPVVEAALAEHSPAVRRGRTPVRFALVLALLCVALVAALSPAGAWIGDRFHHESPSAKPAFAGLPRGGSVLAISGSGAYAIRPDGSTRRLGAFAEAGWSPHGLHVVGVAGRRLVAVDAAGTMKWTLTSHRPVGHPAWSTGLGYAVAYLEGRSLKVVAGNGDPTTNRVLRHDAAPVTSAWRPRSDRVLTYATRSGALATIDVQTGRTLWTAPGAAHALAWTPGGRRVVALRSRSVTVMDRSGHILRMIPLPGVAHAMALHPSGKRAAVVVGRRVLGLRLAGGEPRQLFQGGVDGIAWSADGRRLLLGWRDADQWLLLGPRGRIKALHGVSSELGAAGGFPRVSAWCCAR
jgi:Flp pilus assembly pilin Flp